MSGIKLTLDKFIEKAKKVHGNRFNYSKVVLTRHRNKITIICKEHGEFKQLLNSHLRGNGCSKCGKRYNYTTQEWIEKAKTVHGNYYDYSKVNYIKSTKKVIIICPIHGEFEQNATSHLTGRKCIKCAKMYNYTTEEWIEEAKKVHGDRYDYSKVNYIHNKLKIIIICPKHGEFKQKPNSHLNGQNCMHCKSNSSKGEKILKKLFIDNKIKIIQEYSYPDLIGKGNGLLRFDFAIFENDAPKFLLEYQGMQHFKPWGSREDLIKMSDCTKIHDKLKLEYCKSHNIPLEFINYDQDIEERFYYLLSKYKLA